MKLHLIHDWSKWTKPYKITETKEIADWVPLYSLIPRVVLPSGGWRKEPDGFRYNGNKKVKFTKVFQKKQCLICKKVEREQLY